VHTFAEVLLDCNRRFALLLESGAQFSDLLHQLKMALVCCLHELGLELLDCVFNMLL
jgi:hypothetical protein